MNESEWGVNNLGLELGRVRIRNGEDVKVVCDTVT